MYNQSEALLEQYDLDIKQITKGRGAYICADMNCLNKAIKSKGLERSLKCQIPSDVYEALKKELEKIESR